MTLTPVADTVDPVTGAVMPPVDALATTVQLPIDAVTAMVGATLDPVAATVEPRLDPSATIRRRPRGHILSHGRPLRCKKRDARHERSNQ